MRVDCTFSEYATLEYLLMQYHAITKIGRLM